MSTNKVVLYLWFLIFVIGLLQCVVAPVQEMSDARQAVEAARFIEAEKYASQQLIHAEDLLNQAEEQLEEGDFTLAREKAEAAKQAAIEAREVAKSKKDNDPSPNVENE